ncbi:MAG: T9SS type A sorting domain-containing protein [Bacteroidales bacterium]|nr:T9SS type A sorting domain-containing protein [Bacteroidales bacterium]
MKKALFLLAAVILTANVFAQVTAPRAIKKGEPVVIGNKSAQTVQQKNASANFWFNYAEALENWWGEELDGFGPPIQCDSLGLFPFTDGPAHVQFMSLGQIFDWTHNCWNEFFEGELYEEYQIPALSETNSYNIDSLKLCYYYHWGTNVPTTVVDTLAVSYILNLDDEPIHTPSNSAGPAFSMLYVPYNENTFMADYVSGDNLITLSSNATIVYDKIPLTHDDITDSTYFYYVSLPAPAELTNLSCKKLAVAFTFIPGVERNLNSVIGEDLNTFRTIMSDDPRDEYNGTGTPELLNDVQVGLFTDADNFIPTSNWYGIYNPNLFWQGNPKTYLGLNISCNDCAIVNVEEIENQNVTVMPNPATDNITVNTGSNEQVLVELYNLVGQKVYSENVIGTANINVSNLKAGVYMLKANNHTTKVVVK